MRAALIQKRRFRQAQKVLVMASTPSWLLLAGSGITGLFGVVGVVVGQAVAARRDDRRWERDKVREKRRAEEEFNRHLLVERKRAVQDFLRASWLGYSHFMSFSLWFHSDARTKTEEQFFEFAKESLEKIFVISVALVDVRLNCGKDVIAAASAVEQFILGINLQEVDERGLGEDFRRLIENVAKVARDEMSVDISEDD